MVDYLQEKFQANQNEIEHKIDVPMVSSFYPSGCVVIKRGSTFSVNWNEISGNRNPSAYQICKKGIVSFNFGIILLFFKYI